MKLKQQGKEQKTLKSNFDKGRAQGYYEKLG